MASLSGNVLMPSKQSLTNGSGGGVVEGGEDEEEEEEESSLVVEIGVVEITLPPKLSRVIRLYNKEVRNSCSCLYRAGRCMICAQTASHF